MAVSNKQVQGKNKADKHTESNGKEGDSGRCVGWGGVSAWGALRRQTQEQLGLVPAGAKWEGAC